MVVINKFSPIKLPRNGFEMISFGEESQQRIQRTISEAESEKRWEFAEDVKINLEDEYFWSYWLTKTSKIIKRPHRNATELEEIFAKSKACEFFLNKGNEIGKKITVSAVGDLMCTQGIENSIDFLYEEVEKEIFDADIKFGNLESTFSSGEVKPLTFGGNESPTINLTIEQYNSLVFHKEKKFDILQISNNHIVDSGEEGIIATLAQLEKDKIEQCGVNTSKEEGKRATITTIGGVKIGWVAHTFFLNFRPLPEGKPWLVNVTPFHIEENPSLSKIEEQIKYCKNEKCQLIVVALHWGLEFEAYPHVNQREWAQKIVDMGADIIIGHHPHIIQFSEIMHPVTEPTKDVPVLYSLGNLTPVFSSPESVMSIIAQFDILETHDGLKVKKLSLIPVALITDNYSNKMKVKKLKTLIIEDLDGEMPKYVAEMSQYADFILGTGWRK